MSTIVCFKIGRGGRFHNPGNVSFLRYEDSINKFTEDLFISHKYVDSILAKIGSRPNLKDKFQECQDNDDFTFFEKLGFDLGDKVYTNGQGDSVGLLVDNEGVGVINIDGGYNTTYCKLINDCGDEELKLIVEDEPYNLVQLLVDANYNNVEIFEAFNMLEEMIDNGDDLKINCIVEITKEEHESGNFESKEVNNKFYTND